ncbi:pentapeptide repeat-containing protein, partial [Romboutsia ilealis]|uniref:pentapeptide repeat-containing protein n=1 Tax=Romboutsia ilealis TaxID=1115758 RepID=UPI0026F3F56D
MDKTNSSCDDILNFSIQKLSEHAKNKNKFRKDPILTSTGGIDSSDYTNKSLRRSQVSQKTFYNTKFINSTAAGSTFMHCTFDNCEIINANFQECAFGKNEFKNINKENPITHSNFNRSLFSNDFSISDVDFQHSIFRQAAFINGSLKNIVFYSSTLEDTVFSNVSMEKVRFNDLNIDYSIFDNIRADNVIFPFSQVCFTFGLLPYLMTTKDHIFITSAQNSEGFIKPKEFLLLLPYFEQYYMKTNEFFPLANIYLSLGKYAEAKTIILNGILLATTIFDFRQIKYLSKLIYMHSIFDFHQRKSIYDYINSHIMFCDMNPGLLYSYSTYKSEISSFLLDNNRSGIITAEIDILTNVYPEESEKIGVLLSTLELLIETGKSEKGEHSILFRHNSAEEVFIVIQDIYRALQLLVPAIYSVLLGAFILDEKWKAKKKYKLDQKNASELKEIELERTRIELEREKIALKKEKMEFFQMQTKMEHTTENLRKNIVNYSIDILEINHISYGDIPPEADKKIIQFSSKK